MHRRPNTRTVAYAVVALALAAAAVGPSAVSGGSEQRLYIGVNLHFTGPNTTAGTFVASGAVEDSGTADVQHLAIVPSGQSDQGRLSGTETYNSQLGTIVTSFEGTAFPLSSPHEVGLGRFEIVSGTGAYAGLTGRGEFQVVVDTVSNQLIETEVGNARG
jgi:hypothetical protein